MKFEPGHRARSIRADPGKASIAEYFSPTFRPFFVSSCFRVFVVNHIFEELRRTAMPAYLISQIEVHDPKGYEEYRKLVGASLAKYGGKFIARGGKIDVLEGNWSPKRVVICEFESLERAREWYDSAEYKPAMDIRQKTSDAKIIVVDGM
jgi:uncharacterized protein (DUF1330 family)